MSIRSVAERVGVTPPTRLVWSNEEGDEGGQVTTVTFEDRRGATLLTMRELYPSEATGWRTSRKTPRWFACGGYCRG